MKTRFDKELWPEEISEIRSDERRVCHSDNETSIPQDILNAGKQSNAHDTDPAGAIPNAKSIV